MRKVEDKDLPFKVKRRDRPKIIYKKAWKPRYRGEEEPIAEYNPRLDAIVFYDEKPPLSIQEHEIAHYQLAHGKDKQLITVEEMAEQEIQADLLVYTRTKQPPYYDVPIPPSIEQRLKDLSPKTKYFVFGLYTTFKDLYDRIDAFKGTKPVKMEAVRQSIESAIKKYWRYLPTEWKEAYTIHEQLAQQAIQRERVKPKVSIGGTFKHQRALLVPQKTQQRLLPTAGVYTDRKGERLARKYHRGWRRIY